MIDIKAYSLPLTTPYRWAKGAQTTRGGLIIRMEADGCIGWGETAPPPHIPVDGAALRAEALNAINSLDPLAKDFIEQLDSRTPAVRIRTGITTAYFALMAALNGKSLSVYLGSGWRQPASTVPINGLIGEADPKAAVARCQSIWDEGIRTFKIKCTDEHELDDQRVAAIREAFPEAHLRLDPNEAWTPKNFLNRLETMASFTIDYCEEPIPKEYTLNDLDRFAKLRAQSPMPIALDQSVTGPEITKRIIDAGAADVLIMKSQAMGGFDRAIDIIRLAEAQGVLCVMTSSLETAIGLTASLHGAALLSQPLPACGLSLGRFYARDVAESPPIEDGMMTVPTGFGLGLEAISLD
ncbi:MAG: o-succinylbenzoate synthase [Rhodospirillaceae bacterium]|nr:o-succinylbenzoate synthase [Rhodospirillaceae bacterium]